jgi:tetratricopeptide (TPR) repeat protein
MIPGVAPQALAVLSLTWMLAYAESPGASIADLISIQRIQQEEFEPAVGEQIRHAYEQACKKPRDAEVAGKLGMIFQCYGKYELAEVCYRRARELAPLSFRWAYYLGNIEAWTGRNSEAIIRIREALNIDVKYTPARVRLGQLLFEAGDLDESLRTFEESVRQNARLASAHLGLGRVLAARANWSAAIESYLRACDISPNYAAAHYALGMAYRKTGDAAKAREQLQLHEHLKEASQPSEDPLMNDVNSLYVGGLSHLAKGSSLIREGKTREAIAEFESALRVNPRLIMAHVNLIAMYSDVGQRDKAEQHFREAVALDPGWAEAYYNRGLLLARERKSAEAATAFQRAIELNPNYADAHVQLGSLQDDSAQSSDAQQHFRLALENDPSNRQAHFLLGRSLIRTGQWSDAITHLLETISVDDDKTPICMQTLAVAYQRSGDLDRAMHYIQQARQRAISRKMMELAAQLQKQWEQLSKEAKAP